MEDCDCGCDGNKEFFKLLLKVYVWLLKCAYCLDKIPTGELKLMANYVVKTDNPDVGFHLTIEGVTDSEGNVIADPQGLTTEIVSTDTDVLAFTPTDGDDKSGSVHFGSPGQASLNYSVKNAEGVVLGSGSDGFTLTTGDPAAVTGIEATFDGLTPVTPVPTPTPVTTPSEG